MKRSIKEFGEKIQHDGVGLFYYAGHGLQVSGENYLIPVNAAPQSVQEVKYEAVNAGLVLAQMASAGNDMNIVILDACRNNPFTRSFRSVSEGLAAINAPAGALIAYATAPGSVAGDGGSAGNGIYTQELLKFIRVPGLRIEEVFKQVRVAVRNRTQDKQTPWEESSLTAEFYFTASTKSDDSLSNLGAALISQHQWTEAEAKYRALLGLDPNNVSHHIGLLKALDGQKKWTDAAQVYIGIQRLKPDSWSKSLISDEIKDKKELRAEIKRLKK